MENSFEKQEKESNLEKISKTIELFFNEFNEDGFTMVNDPSITITDDKTLLFVNSTVAKYKREIINNALPEDGYAISQKCLRAWGLLDYMSRGTDLEYNSYFTMLGVVFPGKDSRNILSKTINFLVNVGYDESKILIKTKSDSKHVNVCLPSDEKLNLILDSEEDGYYAWVYGTEEIQGQGITISYLNEHGKVNDIGNIVSVLNRNNEVVAWESGFGAETIVAILEDKSFFEAHPIWDVLEYNNDPELRKFADCLISIIAIINEGVEPGPKMQSYILKKFLNTLFYLNKRLKINIENIVIPYCDLIGTPSGNEISNKINTYLLSILELKKINLIGFEKHVKRHENLTDEQKISLAKSSFSLELEDIAHLLE